MIKGWGRDGEEGEIEKGREQGEGGREAGQTLEP